MFKVKKVNRGIGKVIALLFGLSLFLEVACLPLITSFAIQFDKSVVAEINFEGDQENFEQRTLDGVDFASLVPFKFFPIFETADLDFQFHHDHFLHTVFHEPVFILNHSFRV